MKWFDSIKSPKLKSIKKFPSPTPSGLWKKCSSCEEIMQVTKLEENFQVCPYCDNHFRFTSSERLKMLLDEDSFMGALIKNESKMPLTPQVFMKVHYGVKGALMGNL